MQVNNSIVSSPQFKGNIHLNKLTEVIPNTKACKNLTPLDKNCFHSYVYSLKYKSGITQEEINKIFNLDGMDFLKACYDFIVRKLNIPENLRPPAVIGELSSKDLSMAYEPGKEMITISPNIFNSTKTQIFGCLRHEFQHYMQNLSVYRHEKIGKEAVEFWSKDILEKEKALLEPLYKKTDDELKALGYNGDAFKEIKKMQDLYLNNRTAYDKIYEDCAKRNAESLTDIRNRAIQEMGIVKEGTKEAKRAEIFFKEFKEQANQSSSYYNPDGSLNMKKYLSTAIEQDAYSAGDRWKADAEGSCYLKTLKSPALKIEKLLNEA